MREGILNIFPPTTVEVSQGRKAIGYNGRLFGLLFI